MTGKRGAETKSDGDGGRKRRLGDTSSLTTSTLLMNAPQRSSASTATLTIAPLQSIPTNPVMAKPVIRAWKKVYAERSVVARNWRGPPKFTSKSLLGHLDAVMALHYSAPILISASLDKTLRVWDTNTGLCGAILRGHTDCVRSVQADDGKIVSGSMDKTIRIWNLKTSECVRVIEGILRLT